MILICCDIIKDFGSNLYNKISNLFFFLQGLQGNVSGKENCSKVCSFQLSTSESMHQKIFLHTLLTPPMFGTLAGCSCIPGLFELAT